MGQDGLFFCDHFMFNSPRWLAHFVAHVMCSVNILSQLCSKYAVCNWGNYVM